MTRLRLFRLLPCLEIPPKRVIFTTALLRYLRREMRFRSCIFIGGTLLTAMSGTAQPLPQEAHFNRYTVQDGLPDNNIINLIQDNQGFLWLATYAGLSCFDGVHFTNYYKGENLQNSLPSNSITELEKLPDGRIVIGTQFGISLLDPLRRTFKSALIPSEPGMKFVQNAVATLMLTSKGNIVAGNGVGICVFDTALNVVFQYSHFKKEDLDKTHTGFAHDLLPLNNGDMLIRGWQGLWRYDANKCLVEKQDAQAMGEPVWQAMNSSGKNDLSFWYAGFPDTISVRNLRTGKAEKTKLSNEIKHEIHWRVSLRFVNDTLLGFSSCNYGFRTAVCDPVTLKLRFSERQIFTNQHFNTFLLDREGRWWLAAENGLFGQSFSKSTFRFAVLETGKDIQEFPRNIIALTKVGDRFYAGANDLVLTLDKNLRLLDTTNIPRHLWYVFGMYHWQPGILDVGCSEGWLRLHLPENGRTKIRWENLGPNTAILSQLKDSRGEIWSGTRVRLLRYNPATSQECFYGKGQPCGEFPLQGALKIMETDSGYLWMCGLPGFTRWNPFTQSFDRHFDRAPGTEGTEGFPCAIVSNGGEEILFALDRNGLWRWQGDHRPARSVATGSPALEFVNEIFPDPRPHHFWLMLNAGIALLDVSTLRYRHLTSSDGLPDKAMPDFAMYIDAQTDTNYVCYPHGILVFNRKDFDFSKRTAPIFITGVLQISTGQALDAATRLQLEQPGNDIAISFSSPNFEQGRLLNYAYRLNGGDWQSLGSSKSVRFVSLAPDAYLFEVKSITPEGISSEPARLAFEVLPRFYQTWWFGVLLFAALALAAFGWFRWRLAQLRKVETMRQAIAADLHDEVGASLTSIQILAQLAAHPDPARRNEALEKLPEQVRRTSASLREIVWNIQPKHDALPLLLSELTRHAGEVFEKSEIQYSVQCDEFPEGAALDPVTRQHFTRIFKEVLNNLVRHSGAGRAAVFFKKENQHLVMLVRDDGKGFDVANVRRGNGLDNMQQRAVAVGGSLAIRSRNGEGTETTLHLPLKVKKAWWW